VLGRAQQLARGLARRAPGDPLLAHPVEQPAPVAGELLDLVAAAGRPVAGDVDLGIEREQRVERAQPRLDRPVPHDRRDADEEEIRREHHAHVRHVHDRIGGAVRWAEVEDPRLAAADVERRLGGFPNAAAGGSCRLRARARPPSGGRTCVLSATRPIGVCGPRRRLGKYPVRVPQPQATPRERRELRVAVACNRAGLPGDVARERGHVRHAVEHARKRLGAHRAVAGGGCEHLNVGRQDAVPPPVVAVGVADECAPQRRIRHQRRHRVEHPARQPLIPQRVDQQRLAVADDQPGVRLAEPAVRLEPRPCARRDLAQAAREARRCARQGVCGRVA